MPIANILKEGTIMHIVDSVSAISTQQQPSPFNSAQQVNPTSSGQGDLSGKTFADHLNSHIQKLSASAANGQAENQKNGILMGYYMPVWSRPKPEAKLTVSAYKSS